MFTSDLSVFANFVNNDLPEINPDLGLYLEVEYEKPDALNEIKAVINDEPDIDKEGIIEEAHDIAQKILSIYNGSIHSNISYARIVDDQIINEILIGRVQDGVLTVSKNETFVCNRKAVEEYIIQSAEANTGRNFLVRLLYKYDIEGNITSFTIGYRKVFNLNNDTNLSLCVGYDLEIKDNRYVLKIYCPSSFTDEEYHQHLSECLEYCNSAILKR